MVSTLSMTGIRFFFFSETGGLFGLAIRLMQLFSQVQDDFSRITGILGLYFQIRDDYANLCMKEVRILKLLILTYNVKLYELLVKSSV